MDIFSQRAQTREGKLQVRREEGAEESEGRMLSRGMQGAMEMGNVKNGFRLISHDPHLNPRMIKP